MGMNAGSWNLEEPTVSQVLPSLYFIGSSNSKSSQSGSSSGNSRPFTQANYPKVDMIISTTVLIGRLTVGGSAAREAIFGPRKRVARS